jgi:hypothetical protein
MPIFRRPLMRSTPLDAGDHVNFRKIAPRSSYSCGEGFYFHHSAGADQSAFFAIALLSSFSTQSALSDEIHVRSHVGD